MNLEDGDKMLNSPRQGWQYYECEDCDYKWRETTRDYTSHSMAQCPECKGVEDVITGELDQTIKVDQNGNLAEPIKVEKLE